MRDVFLNESLGSSTLQSCGFLVAGYLSAVGAVYLKNLDEFKKFEARRTAEQQSGSSRAPSKTLLKPSNKPRTSNIVHTTEEPLSRHRPPSNSPTGRVVDHSPGRFASVEEPDGVGAPRTTRGPSLLLDILFDDILLAVVKNSFDWLLYQFETTLDLDGFCVFHLQRTFPAKSAADLNDAMAQSMEASSATSDHAMQGSMKIFLVEVWWFFGR